MIAASTKHKHKSLSAIVLVGFALVSIFFYFKNIWFLCETRPHQLFFSCKCLSIIWYHPVHEWVNFPKEYKKTFIRGKQ